MRQPRIRLGRLLTRLTLKRLRTNRRPELGRRGEALAADYLKKQGYTIVEQNVRSRLGEIDLVAREKDCLVFVEVRTRRTGDFSPEESIGRPKQRKLASLGLQYMQRQRGAESDWRIDIIAIEVDGQDQVVRLDHLKSAVSEQPD